MTPAGACVDIGAFAHAALPSRSTHTDLVQSAVGGYTRPGSSPSGESTPRDGHKSPHSAGNGKGAGRGKGTGRGKGGGRRRGERGGRGRAT